MNWELFTFSGTLTPPSPFESPTLIRIILLWDTEAAFGTNSRYVTSRYIAQSHVASEDREHDTRPFPVQSPPLLQVFAASAAAMSGLSSFADPRD